MSPVRIAALLLGVLAGGCSRRADAPAVATTPAAPQAAHIPTQAQLDRYLAEGPEPTLRRIQAIDYWLHYELMRDTGIEQELGGEAQSIAALKALGEAYERKLRAAENDMSKMIPAFTGEGLQAGFTGMGIGSFLGTITGGMMSGAVSSMSDERLAELSKAGPMKSSKDGGKAEMEIDKDGSLSQSLEFDVQEQGLNGKVRTHSKMTACPDADGKMTLEMEVFSHMDVSGKPGTGGEVHTKFTYERYLDDDARLIASADGTASSLRIQLLGAENFRNQSAEMTTGYKRGGERIGIFRPKDSERAVKLIYEAELLQTLMAEAMMRGLGSQNGAPWEGGRCIDLKVTSNPSNRKGLKPSTAFQIEAKPRVKADGSPARGTVRATLSGGSSLQPATGKVPADATYQYVGPDKKEEDASIVFEARSKRGVGKATLEFDTRVARAYQMEGGASGIHFSGQVCNLEQTFFLRADGDLNNVVIRFEPAAPDGGAYSYSGSMSAWEDGKKYTFRVHGKGSYAVKYADEVATAITAHGPGTVETPYGPQEDEGAERYTLKPLGEGATCTPVD
jgi:hypothetical protein